MSTHPVWLFDLDNTLHDANPYIFPHINRLMREYIERHLQLDSASASQLRQQYWQRYGATLLGLVRHHRVDPAHFLWETHQFPDLRAMLVADRTLPVRLRQLRGRKLVFSNAPSEETFQKPWLERDRQIHDLLVDGHKQAAGEALASYLNDSESLLLDILSSIPKH